VVKNRIDLHVEKLINELLLDYRREPVDIFGYGTVDNENRYLFDKRKSYVRTVRDVAGLFEQGDTTLRRVLEIGCFQGLVSIALSKLGFKVTATDIKEIIECENLQHKFRTHGIDYCGCNLRDYKLPFANEEFDVVVMCQTSEHLNFNPLPVILEINRVTKQNGFVYITVPNIAKLTNRWALIQGKSIHNPIEAFFAQLTPVGRPTGLHWREYTLDEVKYMLEEMDFKVVKQKYAPLQISATPRLSLKATIGRKLVGLVLKSRSMKFLVYACLLDPSLDPDLSNNHTTIASKERTCARQFFVPDASRPAH